MLYVFPVSVSTFNILHLSIRDAGCPHGQIVVNHVHTYIYKYILKIYIYIYISRDRPRHSFTIPVDEPYIYIYHTGK